MLFTTTFFATAFLAVSVVGHGIITSPAHREPGPAFQAACGTTAYSVLSSDQYGPVQNLHQQIGHDPTYNPSKCNLDLCKGMQFSDNAAHTFNYSAGMVIPVSYDIRAPHPGVANLSVIDTASNTMIGKPIKTFAVFAENNGNPDELHWNFTMPKLCGKCSTPGKCVLQFWWDSRPANQTYASCLDFVQ
ncbi:hypothetical protein BDD12DRAFT_880419 [Trichophaea hybrida]|nr:hypothetical protein BDD12DRAFT_880419 [Trichophaea hybrida]